MNLSAVQTLLQRIYDVRTEVDVDDFLITDPALAATLDTSPVARVCDEKLLIGSTPDELALSLFIDAAVLDRLDTDNPQRELHEANLEDFCTALEGVSHFLYVVHRAREGRNVTLLELELQAEVDKYVGVHAVLATQGASVAPRNLLRRLFENVRFDDRLGSVERGRYSDANNFAHRYCGHLESRYLGARSPQALIDELRLFDRLDQTNKLKRIAASPH